MRRYCKTTITETHLCLHGHLSRISRAKRRPNQRSIQL